MKKIFLVFALLILSTTLAFAHGSEEDEHEECPMHEQMEQIYGEEYMDNMHNSMHGELEDNEEFQNMHNSMHNSNFWNKMRLWMRW